MEGGSSTPPQTHKLHNLLLLSPIQMGRSNPAKEDADQRLNSIGQFVLPEVSIMGNSTELFIGCGSSFRLVTWSAELFRSHD